MKKTISTVIILLILTAAKADVELKDDTTIVRPFQISFVTPMGTNGLESGKVTNRISVNLLAGYAGGLEGIEVGGFFNSGNLLFGKENARSG